MLAPARERALDPSALIARLHLPRSATVADIGAGPGFFTLPWARAVPAGHIGAGELS
jgi:precorrin-6B methylase 2